MLKTSLRTGRYWASGRRHEVVGKWCVPSLVKVMRSMVMMGGSFGLGAMLEGWGAGWWAGWWEILDVGGCVFDEVDVNVGVGTMG